MQIFYLVKHIAAKISICAMYLRILVDRWSRIAVIGLIASLIVQTILFFFLVAFQCTPVQSIWDRSVPGFCLNIQAISYAGAAFTITYDCIFIVLPLPQLLKLNIPMRKKLALALLLTLGSVACVASMVRLKFVVTFSHTFDATWDNVEILVWSTLEINLVMICGSLPALRPLLSKVKETMRSYAHRGHKRSAAECEDVAECEDQTKLSDLGQYQASDKSYVLPDSPRRLDEPVSAHD
ncbi:CFEM domain-containing protein [Colletotrichum graminicola]|nr:CFEM domain-containing protein [Colletotrichum graminicola]